MKRTFVVAGLSLLFLSSAVACGSDRPPPRPAAKKKAAKAEPAAMPAAEESKKEQDQEEEPEFVYSPVGKRDPFKSPFKEETVVERAEREQGRPLTKLQRWDLEQLKLQAVITGTSDPMAMVVDPEGVGHVVRRGTLIGKNWGKVTAIRRDCIVITEQIRDATGAVSSVRQERCLPKTEREREFERQFE